MFRLGGGKSILMFASIGSVISCASEAMIEIRSPWIFTFLLRSNQSDTVSKALVQPERMLKARSRVRQEAVRDIMALWSQVRLLLRRLAARRLRAKERVRRAHAKAA